MAVKGALPKGVETELFGFEGVQSESHGHREALDS